MSFNSFPKEKLRQMRIVKIRRDVGPNFNRNDHTKVCSKYFRHEDFTSGDRKRAEKNKATEQTRRKLKGDALCVQF